MADAPAAARFVRALAAAVLREGDAAAHAAEARAALDDVFAGQKSLVLDVQFTGFAQKGTLVGGVDPVLLRAADRLRGLRFGSRWLDPGDFRFPELQRLQRGGLPIRTQHLAQAVINIRGPT